MVRLGEARNSSPKAKWKGKSKSREKPKDLHEDLGDHVEPVDLPKFPKTPFVDHGKKVVNLSWFAKEFLSANVSVPPHYLEYNLAVYVVAKEFPFLWDLREKWTQLFTYPVTDPDLKVFYERIGAEYLKYVPERPKLPVNNTRKGVSRKKYKRVDEKRWPSKVLVYLKKMVARDITKSNSIGVSQLLILKLIGLFDASISYNQAVSLLGGACNLFKMNARFSGNQEAMYALELPDELNAKYIGQGNRFEESRLNQRMEKNIAVLLNNEKLESSCQTERSGDLPSRKRKCVPSEGIQEISGKKIM